MQASGMKPALFASTFLSPLARECHESDQKRLEAQAQRQAAARVEARRQGYVGGVHYRAERAGRCRVGGPRGAGAGDGARPLVRVRTNLRKLQDLLRPHGVKYEGSRIMYS
jgi:hypothetical protein